MDNKTQIQAIMSWSGGKDSCMALYEVLNDTNINVKGLLTTFSTEFSRVSIHGVSTEIMEAQAKAIGLPLIKQFLPPMPSMAIYEAEMLQQLEILKNQGITHIIFGDIFLEDLKVYRETLLDKVGLKALFPLWKKDTMCLIHEFLEKGFQTIIVATQENLKEICGKVIDKPLIASLPPTVDPCGEHGEFHTFVFKGPILQQEVDFKVRAVVYKTFASKDAASESTSVLPTGNWYADLLSGT